MYCPWQEVWRVVLLLSPIFFMKWRLCRGKRKVGLMPCLQKQNTVKSSYRHGIKKLSAILSEVQAWNACQHTTNAYFHYQRARRTDAEPITHKTFSCGCRLSLFCSRLTTTCPARRGKKKTVAGQVDFVRSIYLFQRRFCEIKAAVFFLKNKNTEGVLKSPFFKDTAVSGRYRCVLFHLPPT